MKMHYYTLSATALAIGFALSACNSGGGSGAASATNASTTQGVVTGFGSVFVNGIEYEVAGDTDIQLDGERATESALQVGMLVTLNGTVNPDGKTGTAHRIKFADQLEGVVGANHIAANGVGTLTVMGQTVTVTAETVFESKVAGIISPDLIQAGNIVEVSGYASSGGAITATRIEVKAAAQTAGREIEVKGIVSNLTATTFTLGALTVDYSGVTGTNLPILTNGAYVEVKSTAVYSGSGPLVASKIELEDDDVKGHEGSSGEDVEVQGLVTTDYANNQFELNGRNVLIDTDTRFEGGSAAQLTTGTKVKMEAHFNADGALVADKIEFAHTATLELEGTLEAVDVTNNTLTLMGQVIHVNSNTIMVDKSDAEARFFKLSDLSVSDSTHLKVTAYQDSTTGDLVATKLKRTNFSSKAKIKGTVMANDNGLIVAGITIDTASAGSVPNLSVGSLVEVEGTYSNGVLHATQVEAEH